VVDGGVEGGDREREIFWEKMILGKQNGLVFYFSMHPGF